MDTALIDRARGGDREALERLLEEIAPSIHRFGLRMCRQAADAEDVLRDTLLAVVDHLDEYHGRASLRSWVFALARGACIQRRRGAKSEAHLPEQNVDKTPEFGSSPEQAAEQTGLRAALAHALDVLTDDQREVLLLRDMEGLSTQEVSDSLGVGVDAVKSCLHRARASLRDALNMVYVRVPVASAPSCPDVLRAFSLKLEDDLNSEDCVAMEKHLLGCASCSATCSSLRTALWLCRAHASEELSDQDRNHMQQVVCALITQRGK